MCVSVVFLARRDDIHIISGCRRWCGFSKYLAEYIYRRARRLMCGTRFAYASAEFGVEERGTWEERVGKPAGSASLSLSFPLKIRVAINSRVTSTTQIHDVFSRPSCANFRFFFFSIDHLAVATFVKRRRSRAVTRLSSCVKPRFLIND